MPDSLRREVVMQVAGGLGNQLFQYAMGRRLALHSDSRLVLDHLSAFRNDFYGRSFQLDKFNIRCDYIPMSASYASTRGRLRRRAHRWMNRGRPLETRSYVQENGSEYDPRLRNFRTTRRRVYFEGYWQHEEYFSDIREQLARELSLSVSHDDVNVAWARRIDAVQAVCLHVRRLHGVANAFRAVPLPDRADLQVARDYYDRAVALVAARVTDPHFFVFADYPEWAKEHIKIPFPVEYVTHNGPDRDHEDFWLMGLCRHFVIANSTFSWWAAWLAANRQKLVIAPKANGGLGFEDVPSGWEML